jgi:hypothetical protein
MSDKVQKNFNLNSLSEWLAIMLAVLSICITVYHWVITMNREKPDLSFYQLNNFRSTIYGANSKKHDWKRLVFSQISTDGTLVANHSALQNSIVYFKCKLKYGSKSVDGDWGYLGDNKPPWNIPPQGSISLSPTCTFKVPKAFVKPDDYKLEIKFATTSGNGFVHTFLKEAPTARL